MPAEEKMGIKVATRSIIAHTLLSVKHKNTLRKIFSIMDFSADGGIGPEELKKAYKLFLPELKLEEDHRKITEICINCNFDGTEDSIDYNDFIKASLDLSE